MIFCDLTHAYHDRSGGIRTFLDLKRRYLLDYTDHEHVLIVPGDVPSETRGDRWITVRAPSLPLPFGSTYRFFPRPAPLERILHRLQPDVVELSTYYMYSEWRSAVRYRHAASATGHTSLLGLHYHTDFADSYVKSYTPRWLSPVASPLHRTAQRYVSRILQSADRVMTLAPQFVDKIQTLGVPNPSLVTQFVDLDLFTPALRSESLREAYGVTNDDLLLVYVGRFDSEKHVGTLVRMLHALPASPRAVLVMAGDGPMRGELEAEAQLDSRLRILPYIQVKEDLATLLASADVYTTAGPHEVAAFSVVEAQASGLPVVGVAAGGLLDRVPDDLGVLVPVDDALAMAAAVELLFAKRHTLRPHVRAYVEANYSWTRCFEQIVRLYESQTAASNT